LKLKSGSLGKYENIRCSLYCNSFYALRILLRGHSRHVNTSMTNLIKWFLTRVIVTAGGFRFPYVIVWNEPNRKDAAIHFAEDDRAMNTSMRCHIEALDQSYEDKVNNAQVECDRQLLRRYLTGEKMEE
jgi:hypothetical protein